MYDELAPFHNNAVGAEQPTALVSESQSGGSVLSAFAVMLARTKKRSLFPTLATLALWIMTNTGRFVLGFTASNSTAAIFCRRKRRPLGHTVFDLNSVVCTAPRHSPPRRAGNE